MCVYVYAKKVRRVGRQRVSLCMVRLILAFGICRLPTSIVLYETSTQPPEARTHTLGLIRTIKFGRTHAHTHSFLDIYPLCVTD